MQLLNAVLALVLSFLLSPLTILVVGLVGILAFLALVFPKPAWAVSLWTELKGAFLQAWAGFKPDFHAWLAFIVIGLFFPQFAVIAALAYLVASKLNIKIG